MELIDASELHPERDRSATVVMPPRLEVPDSEPVFEPWDGEMSPPQYRHRLYAFAGRYLAWMQQQYVDQRRADVERATQQARTVESTEAGPVES